MKPEDRRAEIVEFLISQGSASLDELAERFSVSKMTIHRDLDFLESDGLLRKLRGGASIESSGQFESDFRYRAQLSAQEKASITRRAAQFIEPGTSVMIDDGTTSQTIVPWLIEKKPLTVITNNLSIINALTDQSEINLVALGGSFSRKYQGFFGVLTHNTLSALRADVALVSASAIEAGIAYHQDQEILTTKRQMVASSAVSYLMVDHHKFGKTALHRFFRLDAFDGVVVSNELPYHRIRELREMGVKVYIAED
ncbi:MAG: DeoR/GlpR family DNA-binding transcription regulator [Saccharospirillum sp.]|nr:DeoR/GlpR family DNA-binding transcription regulator [Saccharospirillum sp.]